MRTDQTTRQRCVNIVGGEAFSHRGGIQAVNRFVATDLAERGQLNQAFFVGEPVTPATDLAPSLTGRVRGFGGSRLRCALAVLAHAWRRPNDVWLCMHANFALLTLLACLGRRRRAAVFIYAAEMDVEFTAVRRFALRQIPLVIAISAYTKRKALRVGVDAEAVKVLYLGTSASFAAPPERPAETASDGLIKVLFVGRMDEHYKGQRILLEAIELLRKRHPNLRLVFIGGGRTLDAWREEIRARGLEDVVELAGAVTDAQLKAAYENAAVFAMPSENEGFGLVYVEAMAYGIPCIGGDRDAASEVVVAGETGLCVPPRNATAVAAAIHSLITTPEQRLRMGAAGRERFHSQFTFPHYQQRFRALIDGWIEQVN